MRDHWIVLGAAVVVCTATHHPDARAETSRPLPPDSNPVVVLVTSVGEVRIELFPDRAPKTVANFVRLVEAGFYNEMIFHRVVRDFAVQTGLMDFDGQLRPHDVQGLENEADSRLRNARGTVAMARLDDPHSATTEFFINARDNRDLDFQAYTKRGWGFAVFGEVVDGMNVIDTISEVETRRVGPYHDFPRQPVALYEVYLVAGEDDRPG